MILKGNQRANAAELAFHLMKDENEHIRIVEMRGFSSDDLLEALLEIQAISRATQCEKYLYSLSLDPPKEAEICDDLFLDASDRIEARLGLDGQARIVVEHIKDGRTHAHAVWSRIDIESLKAIKLNYPKRKLNDLSYELFLEHGWEIPAGYLPGQEADLMNYSYQEYQEAKRGARDPKFLKHQIKRCWETSDDRISYEAALERCGLFLAQGDRRGFVAVDYDGKVYSLSRFTGVKTKKLSERLGEPDEHRTVTEVKTLIAERMTPKLKEYVEEVKEAAVSELKDFKAYKAEMTEQHRGEREALKMAQDERWQREIAERASRFSPGIKGLWHRVSGRHAQIAAENKLDAERCLERDRQESKALNDRQAKFSQQTQRHIDQARKQYNADLDALHAKLAEYATYQERPELMRERLQDLKKEITESELKVRDYDLEQ
jgi:hypothetical protein